MPSEELIAADETHDVEFKSTARWNVRDGCKDKRMEDAVVKTIAGFLNADGGTLFIGVDDARTPIGLDHDLALVKPPNADGLVNWLTTHLIGALRHTPVMRTRSRIDWVRGREICRVDVARSSSPVHARMSDKREVFWVRMSNSTRALPGSRSRTTSANAGRRSRPSARSADVRERVRDAGETFAALPAGCRGRHGRRPRPTIRYAVTVPTAERRLGSGSPCRRNSSRCTAIASRIPASASSTVSPTE
ncbi:MAG: ATP-binding protein [Solirubrobacteraceae bacterium MAG38_C4-C5]|nr:ATP-binding protein [Candidatus Siliceabacter maunaloa]